MANHGVADHGAQIVAEAPELGAVDEALEAPRQSEQDRLAHVLGVRGLQPAPEGVTEDELPVALVELAPGLVVARVAQALEQIRAGALGRHAPDRPSLDGAPDSVNR